MATLTISARNREKETEKTEQVAFRGPLSEGFLTILLGMTSEQLHNVAADAEVHPILKPAPYYAVDNFPALVRSLQKQLSADTEHRNEHRWILSVDATQPTFTIDLSDTSHITFSQE
jgi:hypothetical protein